MALSCDTCLSIITTYYFKLKLSFLKKCFKSQNLTASFMFPHKCPQWNKIRENWRTAFFCVIMQVKARTQFLATKRQKPEITQEKS